MEEIWLPVNGYEGLYEVSSFGRVRSLNYNKTGKKIILSPGKDTHGYLFVNLCKNGKIKNNRIHRLVATAFLPNWFDDPQVNHIDEDKTNNHVDNLEWCDAKYNANYGTAIERMIKSLSKPVLQFTLNGEFVREWKSIKETERNGFGAVDKCCQGKRKTHKGYIWRYK